MGTLEAGSAESQLPHERGEEEHIDRVKGKAGKKNSGAVRGGDGKDKGKAVEELRGLMEACVKNNFVGVENPRLYSQTYYGTKNLVQNFVDEGEC